MSSPALGLARWASHLARLALTEDELATLAPQLDDILRYVAVLQEVDTSGIEPLSHPLEVTSVFREDAPAPCLSPEEALAGSPGRVGPFHSVPAVLE